MTDPLPPETPSEPAPLDLTRHELCSLVILHALISHGGFPQQPHEVVGRAVAQLATGVLTGLETARTEISQAGA